MKLRNKFRFIILTLLLTIIFPLSISAQYSNYKRNTIRFKEGWSVNLNMGLTSFFGDLSVYDDNIFKKFSDESKIGGGIIVSKKLSNTFTLSGQILNGGLKGTKESSNIYFTGSIIESSFIGLLNLTHFFSPKNPNRKLNLYGTLGIGLVSIKSKLYDFKTDSLIKKFGYGINTIETIIPLGARFAYSLNSSFDLTFDISIRRVDTDKLDTQIGNNNRDYYSYFAFGITYNLFSSKYSDVRYNRTKITPKRKFPTKKKYIRKH